MKTPDQQTTAHVLQTAVGNLQRFQTGQTPLQAEIRELIAKCPAGEKPSNRSHPWRTKWQALFERIRGQDAGHDSALRTLDYHRRVGGEFHITNVDLEFMAYLCMWVERYDPNEHTDAPLLARKLAGGMRLKRMQQAFDRFQASGLTREHCALLAGLSFFIDTQRGDWQMLYTDGKRPWGDSYIELSVYQHCGWTWPVVEHEDRSLTAEESERAWEIIDELAFAAPAAAAVALQTFTPREPQ